MTGLWIAVIALGVLVVVLLLAVRRLRRQCAETVDRAVWLAQSGPALGADIRRDGSPNVRYQAVGERVLHRIPHGPSWPSNTTVYARHRPSDAGPLMSEEVSEEDWRRFEIWRQHP